MDAILALDIVACLYIVGVASVILDWPHVWHRGQRAGCAKCARAALAEADRASRRALDAATQAIRQDRGRRR